MTQHRVICDDVLAGLEMVEGGVVQTCVTSPPYYQLRDYGLPGQIGLEQSPQAYLSMLWAVFSEVGRVLRDDGTLWVNIGDSYAGSNGNGWKQTNSTTNRTTGSAGNASLRGLTGRYDDVPAKSLMMIPERFAWGMLERGWLLRSRIAWCKRSAMPESVQDRPTSAWEHIYLFSKQQRYYYDADAVRQPVSMASDFGKSRPIQAMPSSLARLNGNHHRHRLGNGSVGSASGANLRNFWLLGPEPSAAKHYAAFPTEIPRRAILAGSRAGDTVLDPFLGTGTTSVVAQELGRHSIGIELVPQYVQIATERLRGAQRITGIVKGRVSRGQPQRV